MVVCVCVFANGKCSKCFFPQLPLLVAHCVLPDLYHVAEVELLWELLHESWDYLTVKILTHHFISLYKPGGKDSEIILSVNGVHIPKLTLDLPHLVYTHSSCK